MSAVYLDKVSKVGDVPSPEGWFHSRDEWYFRGEMVAGDGHGDFDYQVAIRHREKVVAVIDAGTWASVFASSSKRGETAETFAAAFDLCNGWPERTDLLYPRRVVDASLAELVRARARLDKEIAVSVGVSPQEEKKA